MGGNLQTQLSLKFFSQLRSIVIDCWDSNRWNTELLPNLVGEENIVQILKFECWVQIGPK